jgi:hypothetical protein
VDRRSARGRERVVEDFATRKVKKDIRCPRDTTL